MFARALLAALSLAVLARSQIITPASAVQCEPVLLTWTASGSPPYIVSVLPGGQVSAAAIENIGTFTNASVTWNVDIPAGTSLTLQLRDGTGQPVYSAPFNVQSSSDTSCLGTNPGYVGGAGLPAKSGGSSASGSGSGSASASAGSTSSAAGSSSSASSASSSSSSAASSTSSASVASTSSASSTSHSTTSSASSTSHATTSSPAATTSSRAMAVASVDFSVAALAGLLGAVLFA